MVLSKGPKRHFEFAALVLPVERQQQLTILLYGRFTNPHWESNDRIVMANCITQKQLIFAQLTKPKKGTHCDWSKDDPSKVKHDFFLLNIANMTC